MESAHQRQNRWPTDALCVQIIEEGSMELRLLTAVVVIGLSLPGKAPAQMNAFPLDMVTPRFQAQTLQTVLEANARSFEPGPGSRARRSPDHTGATPRPAQRPALRGAASTTYRASPQVSAQVRRQFSDWMAKQTSAEGGRLVAQELNRIDPVRSWAQVVGADGLRPGDTADALAGYWILNWVMANSGDSDRTQVLAVREQVRPIIAANPAYARLNEAQRQEFAEVLMLNFLIQHAAYTDALKRGDRNTARRIGDAAVARFRSEMGVDLRQIALTEHGFVRR
ncbi:DUF6683 family protein [Caulobacter sp. LARHSG274]